MYVCTDKAKPWATRGRKVSVLLLMLNRSSNVLLESVLIEGWATEILKKNTWQFFILRKGEKKMTRKNILKKLFLVSAISFLLLSGFSQGIVLADDYYVDAVLGTDDPSYGGLPGNGAWKTITYALSQVSGFSGNPATINVAAGTHNPPLGEVSPLNMESYVSLQGAGQEITILDAEGGGDHDIRVITSDSVNDYFIDGFTIQGGYGSGAGMYCTNSSPIITNCTFSGNKGLYGSQGGGMYNVNSSPIITNCIFYGNSSGGALDPSDNSSPAITNRTSSEFLSEESQGAGMANFFSSPSIINCVFYKNMSTTRGGGISNESSSPIITNCTFYGNSSGWAGGGLYNMSLATITNCILWGNDAQVGPEIYGSSPTLSYCNIDQDGYAGNNGNIRQDPLFVNVTDPDPLNWNLHLQSGSPSIDAGDNTAVPADTTDIDGDGDTGEQLPFDLYGNLRFVDDLMTPDTGNGTPPIVDMGAYEYFDADGDGIPNDVDNCQTTPNGPNGGTCTRDSDNAGANCTNRSDCISSCTSHGDCSMDQEDADEDDIGDVCDDYYPHLNEPVFPTCPDGYYLVGNYEDKLRATTSPMSHTYSFHLDCKADLIVDGFAKEGHPENVNCTLSGGSDPECNQHQDYESFKVGVDGTTFGNYTDYAGSPDVQNAWFNAGPWTTIAPDGDHNLTFTHSEDGTTGIQSVYYKVSVCAKCLDEDNDGVCDQDDNCPTIPNGPARGSCFNYFTHAVWGECLDHSSCQENSGEWWKWCDTFQGDQDDDGTGDVCDSTPF